MRIQRNHTLGREEARRRVEEIAGRLSVLYNLSSSWNGDDLNFTGNGVNGNIVVAESSVDVRVKLGFTLMMLEGTVRSSIEDAMDEHLT